MQQHKETLLMSFDNMVSILSQVNCDIQQFAEVLELMAKKED